MIDVFTEEIEVLIKEGIANLYWYRADLKKAWLRSSVNNKLIEEIYAMKESDGSPISKRKLMDVLYEKLRSHPYDKRLEISRNFVRRLIEHQNFVPQDEKHRVDKAERCALKLKEIIQKQEKEREEREFKKKSAPPDPRHVYNQELEKISNEFKKIKKLEPTKRGYALEKIFTKLMEISKISVHEPFRIKGEQLDGGIKYDGHYYLIELKWTEEKIGGDEIGAFYYKVDGKLDSRGLIISMNGFTDGVLESLPKGKGIKVMLLDGLHLTNVITGIYTFQELLEHAISNAAYKAELYCPHAISG